MGFLWGYWWGSARSRRAISAPNLGPISDLEQVEASVDDDEYQRTARQRVDTWHEQTTRVRHVGGAEGRYVAGRVGFYSADSPRGAPMKKAMRSGTTQLFAWARRKRRRSKEFRSVSSPARSGAGVYLIVNHKQ